MKQSVPNGFWGGFYFALAGTSALVVLIFLPPFLPESARIFVMQAFAGVCHQLPSRSPHIDGVALAVCHRCLGTYLGLPAAVLIFSSLRGLWPFSRKAAPWVLLGAAIPAIVDWSGDVLGIWTNTPVSRMITGGILGLFAGYFLVAAIVDAFVGRKRNRAPASGSTSAESRKQSDQPVIADDP